MKSECLVLSCLARYDGNVWVAICLDFDLAAQGNSLEEAKDKLEEQIKEYVFDALVGEDRDYAHGLLRRKAPIGLRLQFWFYMHVVNPLKKIKVALFIKNKVFPSGFKSGSFYEPLPLIPASK